MSARDKAAVSRNLEPGSFMTPPEIRTKISGYRGTEAADAAGWWAVGGIGRPIVAQRRRDPVLLESRRAVRLVADSSRRQRPSPVDGGHNGRSRDAGAPHGLTGVAGSWRAARGEGRRFSIRPRGCGRPIRGVFRGLQANPGVSSFSAPPSTRSCSDGSMGTRSFVIPRRAANPSGWALPGAVRFGFPAATGNYRDHPQRKPVDGPDEHAVNTGSGEPV